MAGLRKYDLLVTYPSGKQVKVECKLDLYSMVNGQVSVEHDTLKHTEADLFAYGIVVPYMCPREPFEWMADSPDFDHVQASTNGGINALVPMTDPQFLKHFKRIKPDPKWSTQ